MSRILNFFIHLTSSLCYGYTLYYDFTYVEIPGRAKYFGRAKFLTHWNLDLQFVFALISLLNDVLGSEARNRKECSRLQMFRDDIFHSLAFPVSTFVTLLFWTLFSIDRELIFPRALDEFFPNWLNHAMHTMVLFWMVVDLFVCNHSKSSHRKLLFLNGLFCFLYITTVLLIWYFHGFWVYNILAVLSWPSRIAFFIFCFFSFFTIYAICSGLSALVSNKETEIKERRRSKAGRSKRS